MGVRTYGQHCGLAAAMDLVGQRWSMLVIRELAPGPRRFTDIHAGLSGLATDVLAERLRELVVAGVVEHRSVRHPVPAKVYALTEAGVALAEIARRLADWGRPLLPARPSAGAAVRARWALQTMVLGFRGDVARGDYELIVDDEELTVRVSAESASVHYGLPPAGAIARLSCSTAQFFTVVHNPSWLTKPRRGVEVDGAVGDLVALFEAMTLNLGAAASVGG